MLPLSRSSVGRFVRGGCPPLSSAGRASLFGRPSRPLAARASGGTSPATGVYVQRARYSAARDEAATIIADEPDGRAARTNPFAAFAVPETRPPRQVKQAGFQKVPKTSQYADRVRARMTGEGGALPYGVLKSATPAFNNAYLSLHFENVPGPLNVSTFWLRDSCQCPLCVTPSSGQKTFRSTDVPARPRIDKAEVSADGTLTVTWATRELGREPTGVHVSQYAGDVLLRDLAGLTPSRFPAMPARRLWDRARLEQEWQPVAFDDWKDGSSPEFWRGLKDLYELGILVVDGVPETETAVVDVANAIGCIQTTFYGPTWDVVSKPEAENVAYTNAFLCLHQDLMYMREPPYIQLLHCLHNDCDGGESIFSDSVRAATEITMRHPEMVLPLARVPVRYHYERNGHFYYRARPVLDGYQQDGIVKETAWSPPFQDLFSAQPLEDDDLRNAPGKLFQPDGFLLRWRSAARVFNDLVEAPENVFSIKLKPGQCVLFNNRRVLHGRQQFNTSQGTRWLKGTYIAEQTFTSKVHAMVVGGHAGAAAMTAMPPSKAEMYEAEAAQVWQMMAWNMSQKMSRRSN